MLIRIDAASERSIYEQIADSLRASIARGEIGAGDALPSARAVATGLDVHQHTVLHAYQQLRDEGLVDLRRGRGAVVTAAATGIVALFGEARRLAAKAAGLGVAPAALAAIVLHAAPGSTHDQEVIP